MKTLHSRVKSQLIWKLHLETDFSLYDLSKFSKKELQKDFKMTKKSVQHFIEMMHKSGAKFKDDASDTKIGDPKEFYQLYTSKSHLGLDDLPAPTLTEFRKGAVIGMESFSFKKQTGYVDEND